MSQGRSLFSLPSLAASTKNEHSQPQSAFELDLSGIIFGLADELHTVWIPVVTNMYITPSKKAEETGMLLINFSLKLALSQPPLSITGVVVHSPACEQGKCIIEEYRAVASSDTSDDIQLLGEIVVWDQ